MSGFNALVRFWYGIVKIRGANDETEIGNISDSLKVYVSGSNVGLGNLLAGLTFDHIAASYPNSTTEVYIYKSGGSGGTTVATLTVIYTAAAKDLISSVART